MIPLRETASVKRGEHKPPTCEHDEWKFEGVRLHADLTVLAQLTYVLNRSQAATTAQVAADGLIRQRAKP